MGRLSTEAGDANSRPRAWAEIDLAAFAANFALARELAPGGRVLSVLKADAYGHGAAILGRAALEAGAVMLGVGDSSEALELRSAGVRGTILILGALAERELPDVVAAGITPVLHSEGRLSAVEAEAGRQGRVVGVHLKVDTGMSRLGVLPGRALELAERIAISRHLRLDELMSHLAGGEGEESVRSQADLFSNLINEFRRRGLCPGEVHLRNTAGLLDPTVRVEGETLARVGAFLFGFSGSGRARSSSLRPVLALRTQIVFLKDLPAGAQVGYGGTVRVLRVTRVGILPIGYADGVRSRANGQGQSLVRGRRCPFLGRVSMDYTTIDLSDADGAEVGDQVTLIGRDGEDEISVEEVAARAESIPYEILCGLGRRIVRVPAVCP